MFTLKLVVSEVIIETANAASTKIMQIVCDT